LAGIGLIAAGFAVWSCYNAKRPDVVTKITATSATPVVEMKSDNPLNNYPPLPKSPIAKKEVMEHYTTMVNGHLYYLDGRGGQPLAKGWRRFTDGVDVWYIDNNNNSTWVPVYAA
jgi:hypothetical protein